MLIQLTYASRASQILGPSDVRDIVASSQRNNLRLGVTGALCLSNSIFLQQLEGDRSVVNALYLRILADKRHCDSELLDYSEIPSRRFGAWSMGLLSSGDESRQLFLKYSRSSEFDPYLMNTQTLRAFFDEMLHNARWLG